MTDKMNKAIYGKLSNAQDTILDIKDLLEDDDIDYSAIYDLFETCLDELDTAEELVGDAECEDDD